MVGIVVIGGMLAFNAGRKFRKSVDSTTKCLEEDEEWFKDKGYHKEYFKYKYALPKLFIFKNIFFRLLSTLCVILAILSIMSPLIILSFFNLPILLTTVIMILIGIFFFHCSLQVDNFIKSESECKNGIKIEIVYPESFEDKIKTMYIPKNYIFTKEKSGYRYKELKN